MTKTSKKTHIIQVLLTPLMLLGVALFAIAGLLVRFYNWVWDENL